MLKFMETLFVKLLSRTPVYILREFNTENLQVQIEQVTRSKDPGCEQCN